jgi:hypothetical protein
MVVEVGWPVLLQITKQTKIGSSRPDQATAPKRSSTVPRHIFLDHQEGVIDGKES